MKLRSVLLTTACFVAVAGTVLTSCQRERDQDTSDGAEVALFERESDDVVGISQQAYDGDLGQYKTRGNCATVTKDTISFPRTITVDFGPNNCLCKDGKNRRGTILISYTGAYKAAGTIRTITYNNYFVNDNQIKGIKVVTNNGTNVAGNINYTIDTKDTIVKANAGGIVTRQSLRNREYIAGANTAQWIDDKYSITGNASGVRANGFNWSMTITQPLIVDHSCVYRITQGAMEIQPQGKALRTLDYGNGSCDNNATLTINNKTFNIQFK
jgi:hypothetical protein